MKRMKRIISVLIIEFSIPLLHRVPSTGAPSADSANDLLFELLTRQLSQLGHREVILQEEECHQFLVNLNLQVAGEPLANHKEDEDTNGMLMSSAET